MDKKEGKTTKTSDKNAKTTKNETKKAPLVVTGNKAGGAGPAAGQPAPAKPTAKAQAKAPKPEAQGDGTVTIENIEEKSQAREPSGLRPQAQKSSAGASAAKPQKKSRKGIGGAKPKFKKEIVPELERVASLGLTELECCAQIGVSRTALHTYYDRNPGEKERINALRDKPALLARKLLLRAMLGDKEEGVEPDPSLAKWFLEKKKRAEFGSDSYVMERERVAELEGEDGLADGYRGITADLVAPEFSNFYREVKGHKYTHFREPGGRGAGRSSAISLALVDLLMTHRDMHALVCRKVGTTIRDTVFTQTKWAIDILGLSGKFRMNSTLLTMTRVDTGQRIYFKGLDDPGKIKSIKPPFGYIGVFWLEEADQTRGEAELRPVRQSFMRGGDKFWLFESWNTPRRKQHWINERALAEADRRDVRTHHSTYLGLPVEWLGQPFIDEAEALKASNADAYRHEYLGEAIGYGGEVFERLSLEAISDETIRTFDNVKMGIDWGFATDPLAWVKGNFDKTRRVLHLFDELAIHRATDMEAAELLKFRKVTPRDRIFADNEDPKSIENFRRLGFYVLPCTKFPGSYAHGIKFLQDLELIVIDPVRCPVTAREFTNLSFKKNANGECEGEVNKVNDHCVDAARYSLNDEINNHSPTRSGFISAM